MDKTKPIVALFDFDGVIMDTETQYYYFWKEIGDELFPEINDFSRIIKGSTLTQIYDKYFKGMEELQASITQKIIDFEEQMTFDYVAGAEEFLRVLHEKHIPTAIVTSTNQRKMANVYAVHPELKTLVDKVLTAEYFTHSKPSPECYLLGAKELHAAPENCIVFEDSFHGLTAGNAAGMNVIGLSTTNPREAIQDKCKLVIPDFTHFTYEEMLSVLD